MFCNLKVFCRSFMAFAIPWIIFEGGVKGTVAETMLHVNASTRIGGNATIQWNITTDIDNPVIMAEIWKTPKPNFFNYTAGTFLTSNLSCSDLKPFGSQIIKKTAMIDGSLKEVYHILNTNESALYGRIHFTGNFDNGQLWWTILHVIDADLDLVYLLCLRKGKEVLTFLTGYARILKLNESINIFPTVQPTNQPKPDKLSGVAIAACVVGALSLLVLLVLLVCLYRRYKSKKRKDAEKHQKQDPEEVHRNGNGPSN